MFKLFDAHADKSGGTGSAAAEDSLQKNLITEDQLEKALLLQKNEKKGLIEALSSMGLLSQDELANLSNLKLFAIPSIQIQELNIEKGAIRLVSRKFAMHNHLIPLKIERGCLVVAMADPLDISTIEKLRIMTGMPVKPYHADLHNIAEHIEKLYVEKDVMDDFRGSVEEYAGSAEAMEEEPGMKAPEVLSTRQASPVARMVNIVLSRAAEKRASDIHIEPYFDKTFIRFRIDGALIDFTTIPRSAHHAVVSRLKLLSGLDIAETRRPQEGKCRFVIQDQEVEFRIFTLRMVHGEKVAIRILDKSAGTFSLDQMGFSTHNFQRVLDILGRHSGMVAVTGPTGSGRTTTLYSMLERIITPEKNTTTIEDPVEYELERINQVPINLRADMTFAGALRSALRQDPDIIMIGELRDLETAEIAVQASLAGHFVLTTLHTADAPGALSRLVDMGVKPFLVANSVTGVIAQRLVRKICEECKEEYDLSEKKKESLRLVEMLPGRLFRGRGCDACNHTGFRGRTAIHEVLTLSDTITDILLSSRTAGRELFEAAHREGMKTLREDALEKAAKGITTLEEALSAS